MKSTTKEIVLSAIVISLCTVLMILSALISAFAYLVPLICGMFVALVQVEIGSKRAWQVFVSTCLLSFIFCPNKEPFVLFLFFAGFYPIIKVKLDKIKHKSLRLPLKLLIFTACSQAILFVFSYVLMIPDEVFNFFGLPIWLVTLIVTVLMFVMYDVVVTRVLKIYLVKLQYYVHRFLKL